jgi:hypothetical protein
MPMASVQSQLVLVALWAVAGVAAVWVIGPLFLFLTPLRTYETDVREDARETEPRGKEPEYDRRVAELKAAGFEPIGKTVEHIRFFTPLHWRWRSHGARWFASPDRKVYVEIHRLAAGHPQRMSANTVFDGGGLLATSTAPTGMGGEIGERYRRVEIGAEGVDELVRAHQLHVADFSRDAGLRAKAGTLAEVAAETCAITAPFISRGRFAGLYAVAALYVMPVFSVLRMIGRTHRVSWLAPAGLCVAASLFALFRLMALPEFRRTRWVAVVGVVAVSVGLLALVEVAARHRPNHRPTAAGHLTP